MDYNLEIQKILLDVNDTLNYDDKVKTLKEAIRIADKHQDIEWGFDLRMQLIHEELYTSKSKDSFPAFAWVLKAVDENPGLFEDEEYLWEYKWMVGAAVGNASISLEQLDNIMEDLNRRMQRSGYSQRPYYDEKMYYNIQIGDYKKAQEYADLANAEPRDDMTDCEACEAHEQVRILLYQGKIEEAFTKADDLLKSKLFCQEKPLTTFCEFTHFLSLAGDPRAEKYFQKAMDELSSHDPEDRDVGVHIAQLILYMHRTHKPEKWEYFEKIADWEIHGADTFRYDFYKYLIPMLREGGHQRLNLSTQLPYYREDGNYDLSTLYDYYMEAASELATVFDKRHGNTHFQDQLEKAV